MKYNEKHPLNPTPQGDTVAQAVEKNRNEILSLAEFVGSQNYSGSGGGLRQRVLHAKILNGQYAYLTSDGLSVTIDGTSVRVS